MQQLYITDVKAGGLAFAKGLQFFNSSCPNGRSVKPGFPRVALTGEPKGCHVLSSDLTFANALTDANSAGKERFGLCDVSEGC